jgi:hypothetical protein
MQKPLRLRANTITLSFVGLGVLSGQLLGELVRVHRVLERLFAEVVSSQMIGFAMGNRGGGVGVGR